ncbi:type II toxin-antitoxin system RelB family antitoxin [Desulfovibrio inopinatus]|uniref:type II toxin-antitoxin system RelB family antitoxin n=1 Tax=Desulfovibrio inopinatus TaxID=102109 RepID=UPI0004806BC7|nr:TraY domain-containing protein [Desulfovibrio inopinatus]
MDSYEQRLENLAKKTGRTKTFYAREAILAHLEDLEDYCFAAESYAEFWINNKDCISAEDVVNRFDLGD